MWQLTPELSGAQFFARPLGRIVSPQQLMASRVEANRLNCEEVSLCLAHEGA